MKFQHLIWFNVSKWRLEILQKTSLCCTLWGYQW